MSKRITHFFSGLLALPFIHWVATRIFGGRIRSLSFDEKFRSGKWDFIEPKNSELVAVLEKIIDSGDMLMLGCGTASIAAVISPSAYNSILGVDISPVAISKAMRFASDKITFQVGDMQTYQPVQKYKIILFSESLYYLPNRQCITRLKHLAQSLTSDGSFVVTIAQPDRYVELLKAIHASFNVTEDRAFNGSHRHLIVFRPV